MHVCYTYIRVYTYNVVASQTRVIHVYIPGMHGIQLSPLFPPYPGAHVHEIVMLLPISSVPDTLDSEGSSHT
jgi:hypothetical protein